MKVARNEVMNVVGNTHWGLWIQNFILYY